LPPAPSDKKNDNQNQHPNHQPWNRNQKFRTSHTEKAFQASVQDSDQSETIQSTQEPSKDVQESEPSFNAEHFISPENEYPQARDQRTFGGRQAPNSLYSFAFVFDLSAIGNSSYARLAPIDTYSAFAFIKKRFSPWTCNSRNVTQ